MKRYATRIERCVVELVKNERSLYFFLDARNTHFGGSSTFPEITTITISVIVKEQNFLNVLHLVLEMLRLPLIYLNCEENGIDILYKYLCISNIDRIQRLRWMDRWMVGCYEWNKPNKIRGCCLQLVYCTLILCPLCGSAEQGKYKSLQVSLSREIRRHKRLKNNLQIFRLHWWVSGWMDG